MSILTPRKAESTTKTCFTCNTAVQDWDSRIKRIPMRNGDVRIVHFHEMCFEKNSFDNSCMSIGIPLGEVTLIENGKDINLEAVLVELARVMSENGYTLDDIKRMRDGK